MVTAGQFERTIPLPNPVKEKKRRALDYDRRAEGIEYAQGTLHDTGGAHRVLATDAEFERWRALSPNAS